MRRILRAISLYVVLFCTSPLLAQSISRVERPIYADRSLPTFQLHYALFPVAPLEWDPSAKTVVFLQGGPGFKALDSGRPPFIPKNYQVLLLDPRGVGQSTLGPPWASDQNASSSQLIVSDLMAVLQKESLSNYVIWGHSYGTVIATMAAARIEASTIAKPGAIILEGTLGRAFRMNALSQHEIDLGFKEALQRAGESLFPNDKIGVYLRLQSLRESPQGREVVERLLNKVAGQGTYPLTLTLADLARSPWPKFLRNARRYLARTGNNSSEFGQQMLNIACAEIVADLDRKPTRIVMFGGALSFETDFAESCEKSTKTKNYYDAGNFKLHSIPIFYFADSTDPRTPLWQAEYHANQMRETTRTRIVKTDRFGHSPLQSLGPDCQAEALAAAFNGDATADLSLCR